MSLLSTAEHERCTVPGPHLLRELVFALHELPKVGLGPQLVEIALALELWRARKDD